MSPDGGLARASSPCSLCVNRNARVRKIDATSGKITASAGTGTKGESKPGGPAPNADLGGIYCVAFNADFSRLYLTDLDNRRIPVVHMIRKYTPKNGKIVRLAGTGKKGDSKDGGDPRNVSFNEPHGVSVTASGTL